MHVANTTAVVDMGGRIQAVNLGHRYADDDPIVAAYPAMFAPVDADGNAKTPRKARKARKPAAATDTPDEPADAVDGDA